MNFYLECFLNNFKAPVGPEGIARKIGLNIIQSSVNFIKNPVFRRETGFASSESNYQILTLVNLIVNAIAFSALTLESASEFIENQELSEFYKEIALEIKSFYGNYLKAINGSDDDLLYINQRTKEEIKNFYISYKTSKKNIKPMPENNYWVGLAAYVCLVGLRLKKIEEDDPLQIILAKRIQKIEKMVFKIIDDAKRKKLENLAAQIPM